MNNDDAVVALAHENLMLKRQLHETRSLINYPCHRCKLRDECENAWTRKPIGRECEEGTR